MVHSEQCNLFLFGKFIMQRQFTFCGATFWWFWYTVVFVKYFWHSSSFVGAPSVDQTAKLTTDRKFSKQRWMKNSCTNCGSFPKDLWINLLLFLSVTLPFFGEWFGTLRLVRFLVLKTLDLFIFILLSCLFTFWHI